MLSRGGRLAVLLVVGFVVAAVGAWLALSGGGSTPQTGTAFLGVRVHGEGGGATILTVTPGTPAAAAGLRGGKRGDVVTAVDATDVSSSSELVQAIAQHRPGDDVLITFRRGRATTWARVKLATKPPP
jgi:S1-C subfamily serine protease